MMHYAPVDGHAPTYQELQAAVEICRFEAKRADRNTVIDDLRQSLAFFVFPIGVHERRKRFDQCMAARGWRPTDGFPPLAPVGAGPPAANRPASAPSDSGDKLQAGDAEPRDEGSAWIEVTGPDGTRLLYNPATRESVVLPD